MQGNCRTLIINALSRNYEKDNLLLQAIRYQLNYHYHLQLAELTAPIDFFSVLKTDRILAYK